MRGFHALFDGDQQISAWLTRDQFIPWFNDTHAKKFLPYPELVSVDLLGRRKKYKPAA